MWAFGDRLMFDDGPTCPIILEGQERNTIDFDWLVIMMDLCDDN